MRCRIQTKTFVFDIVNVFVNWSPPLCDPALRWHAPTNSRNASAPAVALAALGSAETAAI